MTEETHQKLKEIKQSFLLLMNGVTSQSMREKGVDYHINWGASLGHLQEMAQEYGKDYIARLPEVKLSHSNTPAGPFQRIVLAPLIASANAF